MSDLHKGEPGGPWTVPGALKGNMKNLTVSQTVILLASIAAPIVAYKILGSPEAAAATMTVGLVVNFVIGRVP